MSDMENEKTQKVPVLFYQIYQSDLNVYLKKNMNLDKQFEQRSVNADMYAPLTFESTFLPDSADGLCVLQTEMFTEKQERYKIPVFIHERNNT